MGVLRYDGEDLTRFVRSEHMKTLMRDYQMRRAMIIEGIPAIQIGESPEKIRAKLRGGTS